MGIFSRFFFGRRPRRPSHPASTRLTLEPLEDRQLLSGNAISGYVYHDANDNGLFDAGEQPIANSTLQLLNSAHVAIGATTTDANGYYQFNVDNSISTAPTTQTQTQTVPLTPTKWNNTLSVAQFDPSKGTLTGVEITNAGTVVSDIKVENTSTSSPSVIDGTVSGKLTLTGPGLSLTINPQANAGSFNAGTFDGTFDFAGSSGHDFGVQTATGTQTQLLTDPTALALFVGTGSVALTDSAVSTSSVDGSGNEAAQITTQASSQVTVIYHYIPNNALQPGSYTIVQTTEPAGYLDGLESRNGTVIPNSVGTDLIPVTLAGADLPNNDFGEVMPASVSGYVYVDNNNNGIKESGEPPLAGVTLTLTGTDDLGPVTHTTTTASDGSYSFDGLRPGTYTVTETPPAGYFDGKDAVGSAGGILGNDQLSAIPLASGVNGVNYNFGELLPASLAGTVYSDPNNNGVQDPGEPGLGGVLVTLTGSYAGGPVYQALLTNADGSYRFGNLPLGTYTLSEYHLANYLDGQDTVGSAGGTLGTAQISAITLGSGVNGVNYNFAEVQPASISGFVYVDQNGNGVKDAGDPGLGNVVITLTGTYAGGPVYQALLTNGDGSYTFGNLPPGTYTVTETPPSGYQDGSVSAGSAGGVVGPHQVATVPLTGGVAGANYNFGEVQPPPATSAVYADYYALTPTNFAQPADLPILSKAGFLAIPGQTTLDANTMADVIFVDGVFRNLLGRPLDLAGLTAFVPALRAGTSRGQIVADVLNSPEYLGIEVDHLFAEFLNRAPDAVSRANFVGWLQSGATSLDLAHTILTSQEFNADHPDNQSFLTALYATVLGRSPDPAGLNSWLQQLQSGTTRDQVILTFLYSSEAYLRYIDSAYRTLLHRPADPSGQQATLAWAVANRVDLPAIAQALLASDEYFSGARAAAQS